MPIALLLQRPFARLPTLLAAAKALMPWIGIVRDETVVLARARGAFVVGWFGYSVPRDGSLVRVAIANQAELDARLGEVVAAGSPGSAASALSPAAALAGMVSGMLLSPVGLGVGIYELVRFARFSRVTLLLALTALAGVVFWVSLALGPGAAHVGVAAVLVLVGAAAGPGLLLVLRRQVDAVVATAASAAGLMTAATEFAAQLSGPRSQVRNPLLRSVLDLADRLGELAPQLLGATAFVVDVVGPRLRPTLQVLASIANAASIAQQAIRLAIEDLRATLVRVVVGDLSILPLLARLVMLLRSVGHAVGDALERVCTVAEEALKQGSERLEKAVTSYVDEATELMRKAFKEHPTVQTITTLTGSMKSKTDSPPGTFARLSALLFPPIPPAPDLDKVLEELTVKAPAAPTWEAIQKELARPLPGGPDLSRLMGYLEANAAIGDIARRPSMFRAERRHLRDALAHNRTELRELTDAVATLVGGLLAPALWHRYTADGAPKVDKLMAVIYGDVEAAPAPPRPLPVLRPDEPVPIHPQIRSLRMRVSGASPAEAESLRANLARRINARPYVVAPVTWGA